MKQKLNIDKYNSYRYKGLFVGNTSIGVGVILLLLFFIPNIFKQHYYVLEQSPQASITKSQIVENLRNQNFDYYDGHSDEEIFQAALRKYPELLNKLKVETTGQKLYKKIGSAASAGFGKRFAHQFETQMSEMGAGIMDMMPWNSIKAAEDRRKYVETIYKRKIAGDVELQAYLAWKEDESGWTNLNTVARSLSESLPSLILIGVPLFLLFILNLAINSKKEITKIRTNHGSVKGKWMGFGVKTTGIVSLIIGIVMYSLILINFLIGAIDRIIGSNIIKKHDTVLENGLSDKAVYTFKCFFIFELLILLISLIYFSL